MPECKACGGQFSPHKKNKKYCSDACKLQGVHIAHQKYQQKKKAGIIYREDQRIELNYGK